jgi:endonuclease YncB( thermonuclease family)
MAVREHRISRYFASAISRLFEGVARVVDGDTLLVAGARLRLQGGIDAQRPAKYAKIDS